MCCHFGPCWPEDASVPQPFALNVLLQGSPTPKIGRFFIISFFYRVARFGTYLCGKPPPRGRPRKKAILGAIVPNPWSQQGTESSHVAHGPALRIPSDHGIGCHGVGTTADPCVWEHPASAGRFGPFWPENPIRRDRCLFVPAGSVSRCTCLMSALANPQHSPNPLAPPCCTNRCCYPA